MKHKVLVLNAPFQLPDLSFDHEIDYLKNVNPENILPDIADATIIVTAAVRLSYDVLTRHAHKLECIVCMGTGFDHINQQACREKGVLLCNTPAQNIASVSEHAFALLGALKRKIVPMHAYAMDGETWSANQLMIYKFGAPPRTNQDEIVGIMGYGALGKGVEKLALALGMRVHIAERKGAAHIRQGRTSFDQTLRDCTTIFITAPLDDSTRDMIASPELRTLRNDAYLINVGRGGVVNEAALASALRDEAIAGAATDVFEHEPATKQNCPLIDPSIPNLVLSPHMAYYSSTTINGARKVVRENIEAFVQGRPQNVIISGKP